MLEGRGKNWLPLSVDAIVEPFLACRLVYAVVCLVFLFSTIIRAKDFCTVIVEVEDEQQRVTLTDDVVILVNPLHLEVNLLVVLQAIALVFLLLDVSQQMHLTLPTQTLEQMPECRQLGCARCGGILITSFAFVIECPQMNEHMAVGVATPL